MAPLLANLSYHLGGVAVGGRLLVGAVEAATAAVGVLDRRPTKGSTRSR
jgi:hypothetical protein